VLAEIGYSARTIISLVVFASPSIVREKINQAYP